MPKISVVVCTFNRVKLLKKCLASLSFQSLSQKDFEVIVVDNNSTDNTANFVKTFSRIKQLHYFFEPTIGLATARNTGWRNATSSIVAFLDDDAIASKNWLKNILLAFNKDKEIACVGGKIKPKWQTKKPKWLTKEFFPFLSLLDYGNKELFLSEKSLFGVNMAFTKQALLRFGGFDCSFERKQKKLLSGDDSFLIEKIRSANKKILYSPSAFVWHLIQKERLTKKWFFKRFYWAGVSNTRFLSKLKKKQQLKPFVLHHLALLKMVFSTKTIIGFFSNHQEKHLFKIACYLSEDIGILAEKLHFAK